MEKLTNLEEMIMKCIWNYGKEMPFLQLGKELKEKYDKEIAKKEKKLGRTLEKKEKIKITQTYWYKTMSANDFNGDSKEMYYKLFINNGEKDYNAYWMSSRCVFAYSGLTDFRVRVVDSGDVYADYLYYSSDGDFSRDYAFRPCITLNSNVQVTSGNGTESTPFEIK